MYVYGYGTSQDAPSTDSIPANVSVLSPDDRIPLWSHKSIPSVTQQGMSAKAASLHGPVVTDNAGNGQRVHVIGRSSYLLHCAGYPRLDAETLRRNADSLGVDVTSSSTTTTGESLSGGPDVIGTTPYPSLDTHLQSLKT